MRIWAGLAVAIVISACARNNGTADAGLFNTDSGPDAGATDAGSVYTVTTLANAWANLAQYSGGGVEIDGAVVVAQNTYNSTSTKCTTNTTVETFYIQDASGSPGVAVYRACTDTGPFPAIGDIVNVQGDLSKFDGSLQISTYAKLNLSLSVTIVTAGGGDSTTRTGAYPPAGTPVVIGDATTQAGYINTIADPHPEQLGMALHFDNVTVTTLAPTGFTDTFADGGSHSEGFEIIPAGGSAPGIWVDDANVYSTCIKPLVADGGPGFTIPTGVTGMWDRYQDYYGKGADGGYAPVVPVLVAQTCGDVGIDAGVDGG